MPALSRRSLAAAAAVSAMGVPPVAAANQDARLLGLCSQFLATSAEIAALEQPFWDRGEDPSDAVCERIQALVPGRRGLRSAIAECAATTPAGLLAKARVLYDDTSDGPDAPPRYSAEMHAAWSLARDVMALA